MQTGTDLTAKDMTPRQVAEELDLAYDTVRRLLQAGLLTGYKADRRGQWRVTREALDAFKTGGGVRPQGRPRKNEANG